MITPEFIGQVYVNSLNGDVWQSNSLTPGDWTKIGGSGGGSNIDGVGDPTGVVTPLYTGQYYRDTATGNVWKSTGTKNTLFEAVTKDECVTEAQRLGLSGLEEWQSKDIAEQLKSAYATDKIQGESAFDYSAAIMTQAGATDVATAISATQANRIASGKITQPPIKVK